jgi:glycosyltransferase involved in cell wall biosynthesis
VNISSHRVPLSVIIPIKNEAANLLRCLDCVKWADEIFVVDSQSTDGSIEIAQERGAKVVQFQFNGTWPKKKNWALEHLPFRNEWAFILGAEVEIGKVIAEAGDVVGYWINWRFMFMGRWLRHAYYPNWNLRLFRHALDRYEKLTDAPTDSGDNEVHEHVLIDGFTAKLQVEIDHYAFPLIDVFVEKQPLFELGSARGNGCAHSREIRTNQQRSGRSTAQIENVFALDAISSALTISLRLHLAESFS